MQAYTTKKKAQQLSARPKAQENISKDEMLRLSNASAPKPLSPALREKFEPGFSADFSNIRVSRGYIPPEMGVQAVAQGTDILLDRSANDAVLGHELAHVVQQAQGRVGGGYPVVNDAALEHEADVQGARVAAGEKASDAWTGSMMQIPAMSDTQAPAQCKSIKEKKAEKAQKRAMEKAATKESSRKDDHDGIYVPDFTPDINHFNQLTNFDDMLKGTNKKKRQSRSRANTVAPEPEAFDENNIFGLTPQELIEADSMTGTRETVEPALDEDAIGFPQTSAAHALPNEPYVRKKKKKILHRTLLDSDDDDLIASAAEAEKLGPAPEAPMKKMKPPAEPAPEAPYFTSEMEELLSAPRKKKKRRYITSTID